MARVARACTPLHKAPDSCFKVYEYLDSHFPTTVPDTQNTVVVFGMETARARRGDAWLEERLLGFRHDPPERVEAYIFIYKSCSGG